LANLNLQVGLGIAPKYEGGGVPKERGTGPRPSKLHEPKSQKTAAD